MTSTAAVPHFGREVAVIGFPAATQSAWNCLSCSWLVGLRVSSARTDAAAASIRVAAPHFPKRPSNTRFLANMTGLLLLDGPRTHRPPGRGFDIASRSEGSGGTISGGREVARSQGLRRARKR